MTKERPVDRLVAVLRSRRGSTSFSSYDVQQSLLADPTLIDGFLHRDFSLIDANPRSAQVAWDLVAKHDPEKASKILVVLARQSLGARPAISSIQLLDASIRRSWIGLLDRQDPSDRMRSLIGMASDLLDKFLDGKAHDDPGWTRLELAVRELTDLITPDSRKVGLADRVLGNMRARMQRFAREEWRVKRVLVILTTLGLDINKPRTLLYPNPKRKNGSKITVRHPNLIHELLWVARKRRETCALAACVADVGGHWKEAWDDPGLTEVAQQSLDKSRAVMRNRLGLLVHDRDHPQGNGRAM